MNYTEVLSGVWVSDVKLLQNRDFMIDNQISIILNCTQYYDFPSVDAQKIRLPFSPNVSDETNLQMLKQNKTKIIDFLRQHMEDHNILISCYDGLSISPMIVALLIQEISDINPSGIFEILKTYNPQFQLWCDLRSF
uniref:Tyrosine specific protein phosphatases domain-containing protein n=1 Tax=viral metagenome TaxID=1070528 RepID=A0A6C0FC08_9ZZZZ